MDNFDGYIADIYREMEAELIGSMKRNLGLHQAEEALTGLKYPQWQAMKLKELRRFQRENERIMGEKLSGLPDEVSRQMIEELNQGSKHELKRYRKALKKGYKSAAVMKDSFFHVNDRKVQGLINALNNDLTRANSAVLRMMNDQYRQIIFKAGMFVSNGVYTEEQAVKKAVEEFEKKGLNCIEYKDGRRVNIADYTSMAVRTANQRAYMVGEGEFRKSIGETLVIISRHSTSCPLCKPFENKVLIDDVYSGGSQEDGDYMLLSEAMAQGLYHPRCRHGLGTYYPELEDINGVTTESQGKIKKGLEKMEGSGTILPKRFNTTDDPMREVTGSGLKSHPTEIKNMLDEMKSEGVEIEYRDNTMAYSPSAISGKPGKFIIDKKASYSAWKHEYTHFSDDKTDEYLGLRVFADLEKCIERETRAYNVEIEMAKQLNRPDIVERLEVLKRKELKKYESITE